MSNNEPTNIGACCVGLITVSFIVLKLCGRVTWPWVWVLSPIWISAAMFIIITIIVFLVLLWRS